MASSMAKMEKSDGGLQYLGSARMIAINTVMCMFNFYDYAKQNSGPLKSAVGTVENAVTAVLGPVYQKYEGVPDEAFGFLDKKVGEAVSKFDELAPPSAKSAVGVSHQVVQKAAEISQEMVQEAQVAGPRSAILRFATLSKNFVVGHLPIALYRVNRLPVINSVTEKVIPTATIWSRKYNDFVTKLPSRGYHFFAYFPLIPIEDITKAFKEDKGVGSTVTN